MPDFYTILTFATTQIYTKETLLTIEENSELDLDLNDDKEKIACIIEIERNQIIFYPDRTRHWLIDHHFIVFVLNIIYVSGLNKRITKTGHFFIFSFFIFYFKNMFYRK